MITFPPQENNFNYTFEFQPKTGSVSWSLDFGYQEDTLSLYDNLSFSGLISGEFNESYSLEQNNDYLAIGDPNQGIVDVYENFYYTINGDNVYNKRNKLSGGILDNISGFGKTIALREDYLFVGAPNSNDQKGYAFLFEQFTSNNIGGTGTTEWGQDSFATGSETSGYFGCSIDAVLHNAQYIVAVGATGEKTGQGAVHLYKNDFVNSLGKIEPTDENVSMFGKSLHFTSAENIRYLAIGYEQGGTGKIKMYKESAPNLLDFTPYRTLISDNPSSGDMFGYSIEGDTEYFVIGSPNENGSGAAYYYKYNKDLGLFENKQRIVPADLGAQDYFGKNVSFKNNDGIITSNNSSGKGYIYYNNNDTWEQVSETSGANNVNSGSFGGDISGSFNTSIYNNLLMVGSSNEQPTYIYTTGGATSLQTTGFSISGIDGKLYDNDGNFIYGYSTQTSHKIEGQVFSGNSSIFINNRLYSSDISRNTGAINAWQFSGGDSLRFYYLKIYDIEP